MLGKAVFTCPKTGKKVTLHEDCIRCDQREHHGLHGARPYLACRLAPPKKNRYDRATEYLKTE